MTLRTMEAFGVEFEREGFSFEVYPGVKGGTRYKVPGDYSTASFFLAAGGALYGKVRVNNLLRDDVQADMAFLDALEEFGGARVKRGGRDYVEVEGGASLKLLHSTAPIFRIRSPPYWPLLRPTQRAGA
ncbi:hypothetical protein [Thermococcus sp. JCM 11816]|uniref:hypothetical protein n=1 Tax=Thermococcus sp. (strain JCM 11816 / KS-1) TaxID=1295125 RepID=UPI000B313A74